MRSADDLTFLDFWPLFLLAALAIFAIIVVFRGLRRPADSSKNKSSGGPSFMGQSGRW